MDKRGLEVCVLKTEGPPSSVAWYSILIYCQAFFQGFVDGNKKPARCGL